VLCACFDAFNRDYRVAVLKDVCASMNGPDYHDAALKLIEAALGWVIHSDDLASMLRRPTAA
jgi:nicotinamidase-related amidase